MNAKGASSYRLADDVLVVSVDDEAILLNLGAGKYFGVKGAMRHLLEDLRNGMEFDDMVLRTCARYDVTREEAERDITGVLRQMTGANLL